MTGLSDDLQTALIALQTGIYTLDNISTNHRNSWNVAAVHLQVDMKGVSPLLPD